MSICLFAHGCFTHVSVGLDRIQVTKDLETILLFNLL